MDGAEEARREVADTLRELSLMTDEQIAAAIEGSDHVAEAIERAFEAAVRAAAEEKRWLLARVAAAAFDGADDARIDELLVLLGTVEALDPIHIQLLVQVAQPPDDNFDRGLTVAGSWPETVLEEKFSRAGSLLRPLSTGTRQRGSARGCRPRHLRRRTVLAHHSLRSTIPPLPSRRPVVDTEDGRGLHVRRLAV